MPSPANLAADRIGYPYNAQASHSSNISQYEYVLGQIEKEVTQSLGFLRSRIAQARVPAAPTAAKAAQMAQVRVGTQRPPNEPEMEDLALRLAMAWLAACAMAWAKNPKQYTNIHTAAGEFASSLTIDGQSLKSKVAASERWKKVDMAPSAAALRGAPLPGAMGAQSPLATAKAGAGAPSNAGAALKSSSAASRMGALKR